MTSASKGDRDSGDGCNRKTGAAEEHLERHELSVDETPTGGP